jgi:hypothetical protein
MSLKLDAEVAKTGTRFRIFPHPRYLKGFATPETVWVSVPPDKIKVGPADDRMYVVDAVNKLPYSDWTGPPYQGKTNDPVKPGPDGHFDGIDPDSREFSSAAMYATIRRVLDIWEDYLGHTIHWYFANSQLTRLELIPLINWDNAQSGAGFLEYGYGRKPGGGIDYTRPYCQNFDVLAHELGHNIVFAVMGVPKDPSDPAIDYFGMHEASGDLAAIVAALHFHTLVDHLLENTCGNLFTDNELDRVGELSENRQIRIAFNNCRMSDIQHSPDPTEPHFRSLPLTGGIFDVMVEVFQKDLVHANLISQDLADKSCNPKGGIAGRKEIQSAFKVAYQGHEKEFKVALMKARDYLGHLLAATWGLLSPNRLTYYEVLRGLLAADRQVSGGQHRTTIHDCFVWREITFPPDSPFLQIRRLDDRGVITTTPDTAVPLPPVPAAGNGHVAQRAAPPVSPTTTRQTRAARTRRKSTVS